ncbi:MAG: hypothetical protein ACXVA9_12245 [Bdellovibrionales bacterium]
MTGFDRREGQALDLFENNRCTWLEAVTACYPTLGLAELARLHSGLVHARPELAQELSASFFQAYGLRWCDRLQETLRALLLTPFEFQTFVDEKKWGARDLAALLALPDVAAISVFLAALAELPLSKSQAVQAMEWVIELFLMGRPLNDLLPSGPNGEAYMLRLQQWRKPQSAARDEQWSKTVGEWPWPAQVQGQWQRFGDQAGLEIKIRTTSAADFQKKLERLISIRDTWSCNG